MRNLIRNGLLAAALIGANLAVASPGAKPTGDVQKDQAEAKKLDEAGWAAWRKAAADVKAAEAAEQTARNDELAAQALRAEAQRDWRAARWYRNDAKTEEREAIEAYGEYLRFEGLAQRSRNDSQHCKNVIAAENKEIGNDQAQIKDFQDALKHANTPAQKNAINGCIKGANDDIKARQTKIAQEQTAEKNFDAAAANYEKEAQASKAAALKDDPNVANHFK